MSARANRWVVAVAIAGLMVGVLLSHVIESGIRVEKLTLAGDTPAIRLCPRTPAPHPIALLAHGVTASKETLFRFGEALAAAGFDCFAVDLPGHGESRESFSIHEVALKPEAIARALGSVDVFLGHSMGAGAGAWSVRQAGLHPKLFIAVGADATLSEHGPPLLLLAGRFEELIRPAQLKARTDARVLISPWSDHALEPYDPRLVNAAVVAACVVVGKTPPAPPTAWMWRVTGLVLGMASALGLILCLPELHPRFVRASGFLAPVIIIVVVVLTTGTWVGGAPHLHRIPLQIALAVVVWLALAGVGKLRMPRWSVAASAVVVTLGYMIVVACMGMPLGLLALVMALATVLIWAGAIVGWIAARRGTRLDGDIAMAIFVSYAVGQCVPNFF